jgi:hypothetical protein
MLVNGADGISDIEGKAVTEAASKRGRERVSIEAVGVMSSKKNASFPACRLTHESRPMSWMLYHPLGILRHSSLVRCETRDCRRVNLSANVGLAA